MLAEALFWISLSLLAIVYAGYPALMSMLARKPPVKDSGAELPSVTVVIAARNEQAVIVPKLRSVIAQAYPADLLDIILVSDGSTDETVARAAEASRTRLQIVELQSSVGKSAAINEAMKLATGSVVVLTDARQPLDRDAVRHLVENFTDPSVGAVSGDLRYDRARESGMQRALHRYWDYEKRIRLGESRIHSVVGVTGALYAMRRELWTTLPAGTLLDDVYTPMSVVLKGHRVVFDPRAWARDEASTGDEHEFRRRVRTLTGNYQLLALIPGLLSPFRNPVWLQFALHKIGRLVSPLLLIGTLVGAGLAAGTGYQAMFYLQLLFWVAIALVSATRTALRFAWPVALPYAFAMTQAAAVMALVHSVRGRWDVWGN